MHLMPKKGIKETHRIMIASFQILVLFAIFILFENGHDSCTTIFRF